MDMISTSTISALDLLNISKDVAQLNLGYLGISVGIIGVLGGIFVYFNLNPLKEKLNKQEEKIENLRTEARDLLNQSKDQVEKTLNEFTINQSKKVISVIKRQKNEMDLETKNKIQVAQAFLLDRIENISESKDLKLKEIVLAETSNQLATLEKNLNSNISLTKEEILKQIKLTGDGFRMIIKELNKKIKELQVYKFSKEGQMGAIIISIELLEDSIDEYVKLKERLKGKLKVPFDAETFGWEVVNKLNGLIKEIGDNLLEEAYISRINSQINKIEDESAFSVLINQLKEKLKSLKKPNESGE